MKTLLGDFNAEVGKERIFSNQQLGMRGHRDSNADGFRIVNYATSKNLVKSTMFPH